MDLMLDLPYNCTFENSKTDNQSGKVLYKATDQQTNSTNHQAGETHPSTTDRLRQSPGWDS